MKPIKITAENAAAIEAALKEVNGRAYQHAYTSLGEVEALAKTAEKRLESMGLPKAMCAGGGAGRLGLTQEQDAEVVRRLRESYFVVKSVAAAA